ncbi:tail fiber assembly protein [Enterobacteriaceae bacterium 155047]|uniref:tail fiber assembly protein n=1 Tax=Huaxiibacter chinensis TaxID=2899785 RepID=UPI002164AA17|nr:tail fiber assembly protein [Huaxiibacter chinensis]MCG5044488.1 tail fiber assembly protein [Huaxiibacter chinensis]
MDNQIYYSAGRQGFYFESDKAACVAGAGWPEDASAISERWYQYLIENQAKGSSIVPNEYGQPVLQAVKIDYPAIARAQKELLISNALQSVSVIQLKLQAGRVLSDAETEKLNVVLDYIDIVEKIKTETVAGQVDWPPVPE